MNPYYKKQRREHVVIHIRYNNKENFYEIPES